MLYSYSYFNGKKKKKRQSLKRDTFPLAAVRRQQDSLTSGSITRQNSQGVLGRPWSSAPTHPHALTITSDISNQYNSKMLHKSWSIFSEAAVCNNHIVMSATVHMYFFLLLTDTHLWSTDSGGSNEAFSRALSTNPESLRNLWTSLRSPAENCCFPMHTALIVTIPSG